MHIRRIVSVGGLLAAAVALAVSWPVALLAAATYDIWVDRRFPVVRALVWFTGVLVAELAGVGAALLIPARAQAANYRLQRVWARTLIRWTQWVYRLRLELTGDALGDEPFLLLPRHASLADTLLPLWVTDGPKPLRPRYALKRELLWDPCLDIVGNRLPNAFIDRRLGADGAIAEVAALGDHLGPDDFVVVFPEGTRFSEERRARVLERLQASGDTPRVLEARGLTNVLPIRPGGTVGILGRRPIDVVLMAHTGLEGTRTLADALRGQLIGKTIRVHLRRFRASDLPDSDADRVQWLRIAWRWMDETVGQLRRAA